MTAKPAHITLNGRPLCECEQHHSGLLGPDSPIPFSLRSCGFYSIAEAKRAKALMQAHRAGLKVVPGHCPAYSG